MENKEKTSWGSPKDWGTAIGILIAAIGLLSLISGIWTPDAAQSAGSANTMRSVVILVVGIVIAGGSQIFFKPKS
jgi:hypothetical protein